MAESCSVKASTTSMSDSGLGFSPRQGNSVQFLQIGQRSAAFCVLLFGSRMGNVLDVKCP